MTIFGHEHSKQNKKIRAALIEYSSLLFQIEVITSSYRSALRNGS